MGFAYQAGELGLEQKGKFVSLPSLLGKIQGPCFVYDGNFVLERLALLKRILPPGTSIHYAMKANSYPALLQLLKKQGEVGVDVVSKGEIERARDCGFKGADMVFSGVGKSQEEIGLALSLKVRQINVESLPELKRIATIAKQMKVKASLALRVNPNVDIATHPYIKTGFRDHKFGIDEAQVDQAIQECLEHKDSLDLVGLAIHLGSLMMDPEGLSEALGKVLQWRKRFEASGLKLQTLDIGGGWGIDYKQEAASDENLISKFGEQVARILAGVESQILFEPGRILVARAGVLMTRVEYVKQTPFKRFVVVDSGIHHLVRPAMYQAYHRILPMTQAKGATHLSDVVGPLCESSDTLGLARELPDLKEGDWLAVCDAGAYGSSMSSQYNLRAPAKEIMVLNGQIQEVD